MERSEQSRLASLADEPVSGAEVGVAVLGEGGWQQIGLDALSREGHQLAWIDIQGRPRDAEEALRTLSTRLPELADLDPRRATEGGESPPRRPPKAKAFERVIFARAYWLGVPNTEDDSGVLAQEVHVIGGSSFVVTMRYPLQAWDVDRMEWISSTGIRGVGFQIDVAHREVINLRRRLSRGGSSDAFGLEGMAVVVDQLVDSVFDALDAIRIRADGLEHQVVHDRPGDSSSGLAERTLRMRRLLRQIRWAFLPADEISELLSGPHLELNDAGIRFRFDDLCREANRALETVHDVIEQAQQTVVLANSLKTDRLNATIYVLTVVATLLLVPTVIAGIYGMNFADIPGTASRAWFWGVVGAMLVIGLAVWMVIHIYLERRHVSSSAQRDQRTP
jgi:hypothetical protein